MMKKIKKYVKKVIFYMLGKIQYFRHKHFYKKILNQLIKKHNEKIKPLTDVQISQIKAYWNQFGIKIDADWHKLMYSITGMQTPCFLTEQAFHQDIKKHMNQPMFASVWGDKAYIDMFLKDVKAVRCVIRNVNGRFLDENFQLVDRNQVAQIISKYDSLVIKPSTNTHTGHGVKLLTQPYDLDSIIREYGKNYVIQIPLMQHEDMAKLNASSINTIRVNSVLFEKEAHVMSAFVKVGQAGEFADNHGSNRFFVGIRNDGTYMDYAVDCNLNKYSSIPSGYAFAGKPVPYYEQLCKAIENAHQCIPHFGFAYWDVCIDASGIPVVVEINLRNPDTNIAQAACGPYFGEFTEPIMRYIAENA